MKKKKIKVLYFYIPHTSSKLPFNSFNIHIMEFMNHANQLPNIEVIGAYEMARTPQKTVWYLQLFHRIKNWLPRSLKDILAIGANIPDFIHAYKKIKELQPDLIMFRYNYMNFYQNFIKMLTGLPILLEVNSPITEEKINTNQISLKSISRFFEIWSWKTADKIYVVSEELKTILSKDVPSNKITAIHNGSNPTLYKTLEKRHTGRTTIGFVGNFQKNYGIESLFTSIPDIILSYEHVDFYLLGDGDLYHEFKTIVDGNPLFHNRVFLPGHVEYEKIPEYLTKMDITFLMDFTEYGSPLKLFEYMIAETCIIVPDRKTIHEVLEDGKEALFFRPRDSEDFKRALISVLENNKLRKKLAHNAFKKVKNQYTWHHNAVQIASLIESLYSNRHGYHSLY